jgi:hypothetical protein
VDEAKTKNIKGEWNYMHVMINTCIKNNIVLYNNGTPARSRSLPELDKPVMTGRSNQTVYS